jgi:hypothetical protein
MSSHCFIRSTHMRRNSFEYRPTRLLASLPPDINFWGITVYKK